MKKTVVAIALMLCIVLGLSGCDILTSKKNSIGKTGNTMISVYDALKENLDSRGLDGYSLYGAKLTVNSENVGKYIYVYANKRPDDMNYSDILLVEVNNRTGKIEKCGPPDYAVYADMPYEMTSSAMPIDPDSFLIDSDAAVKKAALAHQGDGFVYNYTELVMRYKDGKPLYDIGHISLVNNCIYHTCVDVMTGDVLNTYVEEM